MSGMSTIARLGLVIGANTREFDSALTRSQRNFVNFGKQMQKTGKNMSLAISTPLIAIGASAVKAFDVQAKAVAQVEQALKTTQGAVGRTSEELQKMASELQSNTLFGDEEILKNATAQLLTFTNVTGQQFDRAQKAALDLATRLDGDLKSASIQLGKALNDPATGLSMLSRSGITFSKEQTKVIKALQESGQLAEAQGLILSELERQYGGSAEAAVVGAGKLQQLGNTIGDITEEFGALILEALDPVIEKIKAWAKSFQELSPATKKIIAIVAGITAAVGPLLLAIGYLSTNVMPGLIKVFGGASSAMGGFAKKAIPAVASAMTKLWAIMAANPIIAITTAVVALGAAVYAAVKNFNSLSDGQKALNEVTKQAQQAVASERAELEQLTSVARNENLSKETREKAIRRLNELSPEYLGNLRLENINTQEATNALNAHIESLEKRARITAAQEKLVEIERKLIEAQQDLEDGPSFWEKEAAAIVPIPGLLSAAEINTGRYNKEVASLNEQKKALLGLLVESEAGLASIVEPTNNAAEATNNYAAAIARVAEMQKTNTLGPSTIEGPQVGAPQLQTYDTPLFDEQAIASSSLLLDTLNEIGITTENVGGMFADMGARVGDAFANMGSDGETAFQALANSVRESIAAIIDALVSKAIAGVISNSFATLPPPVAAGVAAGFAGVAKGLFKSLIPAFAEGGLVTGPMLAMVGDNASGKEAIIPFEKMGQFLGMAGGNQNVRVYGDFTIEGTKLRAVLKNTDALRSNSL